MAIPVSTASATGTTSVTVTQPSGGWVSGSLLIAVVSIFGTNSLPSAPTGWTLVVQRSSAGTTGATSCSIFSQALTSAGASSYTFATTGATEAAAGILEYDPTTASGVDTSATSNNAGTTATALSWNGITTSNASEVVCLAISLATGSQTVSGWSTGFAEELHQLGAAGEASFYIADGVVAAAGATGAHSATLSGSAAHWAAVSFALLPPSTGASPALIGLAATSSIGSLAAADTLALSSLTAATAEGTPSVADTVSVAGLSATTTKGAPATTESASVSGIAATTAAASPTIAEKVGISGLPATTGIGALTVSTVAITNVAVSGVAATTAAGSPTVAETIPAAGLAATTAKGAPIAAGMVSVAGLSATTAEGTLAVAESTPVSGIAATTAAGSPVTAEKLGISGLPATTGISTLTVSTSATTSVALSGVAATTIIGAPAIAETIAAASLNATTAKGTPSAAENVPVASLNMATAENAPAIADKISIAGLSITTANASPSVTEILAPGTGERGLFSAHTTLGTPAEADTIAVGSLAATADIGALTVSAGSNANVALSGLAASAGQGAPSIAEQVPIIGLAAAVGKSVPTTGDTIAVSPLAASGGITAPAINEIIAVPPLSAAAAAGAVSVTTISNATLPSLSAAGTLSAPAITEATSIFGVGASATFADPNAGSAAAPSGLAASSAQAPLAVAETVATGPLAVSTAIGAVTTTLGNVSLLIVNPDLVVAEPTNWANQGGAPLTWPVKGPGELDNFSYDLRAAFQAEGIAGLTSYTAQISPLGGFPSAGDMIIATQQPLNIVQSNGPWTNVITVQLGLGVVGQTYSVTFIVTTTDGRTIVRSIWLTCQNRSLFLGAGPPVEAVKPATVPTAPLLGGVNNTLTAVGLDSHFTISTGVSGETLDLLLAPADILNTLGYTPFSENGGTITGNVLVSGAVTATTVTAGSGTITGLLQAGTIEQTGAVGIANVLIGPTVGSPAAPTFRPLQASDLPVAVSGTPGIIVAGTGLVVTNGELSVLYGTNAGTAMEGNDSRISEALQAPNNLSDVVSKPAALANLGGISSSQAAAAAPVQSVAGRTGTITLTTADVSGFVAAAAAAAPVQSVAGRTGAVVLSHTDVSGLGGAAVLNVGTLVNTVAAGNDARILGAAQVGNNLSDLFNIPTARTNLGLTGIATATLGTGLVLSGGVLSANGAGYTLPAATSGTLGGVIVGSSLTVASGTINVNYGTVANSAAVGNDTRITGAAQKSANLSDLANAATALFNLGGVNSTQAAAAAPVQSVAARTGTVVLTHADIGGLGGAAVLNVGTATGTVAAGDDSRITGAAQKANNLSDLASATTARTNLGLTGIATAAVGAGLLLSGGTLSATYVLPNATTTTLGGMIVGSGLVVASGIVSVIYGTAANTAAQGNDARIVGAAQTANNLSDLANEATARTNLGLTSIATAAVGTGLVLSTGTLSLPFATTTTLGGVIASSGIAVTNGNISVIYGTAINTAAQGNDSRITGAAQTANNLSDLASATTARTNLGLTSIATATVGSGLILSGGVLSANVSGVYTLPNATTTTLGGVIVGSGLAVASGAISIIYGTAANTAAQGNDARIIGAAQVANNLSDLANEATARTNLGLTTLATATVGSGLSLSGGVLSANGGGYTLPNATTTTLGGVIVGSGLAVASGTVSVIYGTAANTAAQGNDTRIVGAAQTANNLSDLANKSTALTNLGGVTSGQAAAAAPVQSVAGRTGVIALTSTDIGGLGGAALLNVGTTTGTVAAGDDSRITGAAQKANNLSDLASKTTALTNLGGVTSAQAAAAAPVQSVAGRTGTVVLSHSDISGLGGAAVLNVGTLAGMVAAGNDSRIIGAAQVANNLSDLTVPATALANIGGVNAAGAAAAAPVQSVVGAAGAITVTQLVAGGMVAAANAKVAGLSNTGANVGQTIIFDSFTGAYSGLANYTSVATDECIIVNKSPSAPLSAQGPTTITIPAAGNIGRSLIIKDGRGDANINNITIQPANGLIDGGSPALITTRYGGVCLKDASTQWLIISRT